MSIAIPILILSLISGKQPHYLLPIFPSIALAGAVFTMSLSKNDFINGRWDMLPQTFFLLLLGVAASLGPEIGNVLDRSIWTTNINRWWAIPLIGLGITILIYPPDAGFSRLFGMFSLNIIFVTCLFGVFNPILAYGYNLKPIGAYISNAQMQGYTIGYYGKYHGQFHFLGRLKQPFIEIGDSNIKDWLAKTPKAKIISVQKNIDYKIPRPELTHRFRGKFITIWDRSSLINFPGAAQRK